MRILFLSRWYPYPPDNGSKLRVFSLLSGLCGAHDVTLVSFCNPAEKNAGPSAGVPLPVQTHLCPYREFEPRSRRAMLGFLSATPRYLIDTHNPEMERLIREAVRASRCELVIASQLPMAAYYQAFRGIPAIFDEVELGIYWPDEQGSIAGRARQWLTWTKQRRFLSGMLESFNSCTVVSDVERQLLAKAVPGYEAVHIVPNSVSAGPADAPAGVPIPDSLIFTGSLRFAPNHDAMQWFLGEVFPSVQAQVPEAQLTITGDAGSERPTAGTRVVFTGQVPDVRPLVAASAVSVAPIRVGGGTRLKILEAMAIGTPVVATTKAVEGLDVRNGEHLLIADTPREFANAVVHILKSPAVAAALADRARRLVRARYDSKVVVPNFLQLVERAVAA